MGITDDPFHPIQAVILELAQEPPLSGYLSPLLRMSARLNRFAADRAAQLEEALVLLEIDKVLLTYVNGLAINGAINAPVVIDNDSVIVRLDVAKQHRKEYAEAQGDAETPETPTGDGAQSGKDEAPEKEGADEKQKLPTRFRGTVIICADRPVRDMHQIVEAIVQQLTTLPDASVELMLDIDAEFPAGIDKAKSRTLLENANTLEFIDKALD